MRTSSQFIFLKSCCDIDILAEILDWMACCIGLFDLLHELMRHLSTDLLRLTIGLLELARSKTPRIHIRH